MNISGIKNRIDKVQEKIAPPKNLYTAISRQLFKPGRDADGNNKPCPVGEANIYKLKPWS